MSSIPVSIPLAIEVHPAQIVGTGGAIGALCRHYLSKWVDSEDFPSGTFTVNTIGSFVLASITFLGINHEFMLLLGTGACGSFTTFSSFSFETVRLWETGDHTRAMINAGGNLVGAFLAIGVAWALIRVVTTVV